jgi:hypothetical protein
VMVTFYGSPSFLIIYYLFSPTLRIYQEFPCYNYVNYGAKG